MVSIEYLESERQMIWAKIVELQSLIEKKTSDYENDAKQASKKCSEYKNKCDATKDEAAQLLLNVKKITDDIHQSNVRTLITEIQTFRDEFLPKKDILITQLEEFDSLFAEYSTYAENLKKLDGISSSADETSMKIETIFKQLAARKKEIDQFYLDIFGYSESDVATGDALLVTGLKDELEKTFSELKISFETFSINKNNEFNDTLSKWKTEQSQLANKVKSLLPDALTAGLCSAYSKKKEDEISESKALDRVFKKYVYGLIGISFIPFTISIYLLIQGISLDETILKIPRLVLSILPLYVPVLWVAISANRKMNLSKRLIEEYTHKEVLSKTFEGLANQIQDIEDSDIANDLKTRLLYNILEVSSENPGKLISNYNKSDHPLMDALDKSVKLTNAIEHLSKIPGMSKLVNVLDNKSKLTLEKEVTKAVS
ncbi:MAG: hypothetical protein K8R50_07385 [Betaproteobacteria bacterium]|nr:hypothetical protein [Betaproteobacteria bacterium]